MRSTIFCVAGTAKWTSWTTVHHLTDALAARYNVVFIQAEIPRVTIGRALRRPNQAGEPLRFEAKPNVTVYTFPRLFPSLLHWLPPGIDRLSFKLARRMNEARLESFVAHVAEREARNEAILWTTDPLWPGVMRCYPWTLKVYHCLDPVDEVPGHAKVKDIVRQQERRLIEQSDLVFAVSHDLMDRCKRWNPCTYRLPNGVDVAHFGSARRAKTVVPAEMRASSPVIGYVGGVDWRVDLDLVEYVAGARPEWQIVLVGEVKGIPTTRHKRLEQGFGVRFLGMRPYAEIPAYLKGIDVCLIPWVVNAATQAMDPLKLYEYLAAGKPVVAVALPQLQPFRDVIYIAQGGDDFVNAIDLALKHRNRSRIKAGIAIAYQNSWQQRVSEAQAHLAARLSAPQVVEK